MLAESSCNDLLGRMTKMATQLSQMKRAGILEPAGERESITACRTSVDYSIGRKMADADATQSITSFSLESREAGVKQSDASPVQADIPHNHASNGWGLHPSSLSLAINIFGNGYHQNQSVPTEPHPGITMSLPQAQALTNNINFYASTSLGYPTTAGVSYNGENQDVASFSAFHGYNGSGSNVATVCDKYNTFANMVEQQTSTENCNPRISAATELCNEQTDDDDISEDDSANDGKSACDDNNNQAVTGEDDERPKSSKKGDRLQRIRTKNKYRVVYTDHQRLELEKQYHYSKYITIKRKSELSQMLDLSERQVKIWFQNRRAKERKQSKRHDDLRRVQEAEADTLTPNCEDLTEVYSTFTGGGGPGGSVPSAQILGDPAQQAQAMAQYHQSMIGQYYGQPQTATQHHLVHTNLHFEAFEALHNGNGAAFCDELQNGFAMAGAAPTHPLQQYGLLAQQHHNEQQQSSYAASQLSPVQSPRNTSDVIVKQEKTGDFF